MDAGLLDDTMFVRRGLGHSDDLLVSHAHIHGEARCLMQGHFLDLQVWIESPAAASWEPTISILVQVLGASIEDNVGGRAPSQLAEESPDLLTF
jgi:hypothetical protein